MARLSNLSKAVADDASFYMAHLGWAQALDRQGKIDEAIEQVNRALEIVPDEALAHTSLSRLYQQKGMIEEAEKEMAIFSQTLSKYLKMARVLKMRTSCLGVLSVFVLMACVTANANPVDSLLARAQSDTLTPLDYRIGLLRKALSVDGDRADVCAALGALFMQKNTPASRMRADAIFIARLCWIPRI